MNSGDPADSVILAGEVEIDVEQIYQDLKRMAQVRMALEQRIVTLSTTALVHEAWLRLEKSAPGRWRDKWQFFSAAGEAMRRILVEAARKRQAAKRGGGDEVVSIEDVELAAEGSDERLLAVNEALEHLEVEHPDRARIVKLRFFGGLDNSEIAALVGVNEKTVRRQWELAKVWLYRFLQGEP